MRDLIYSPGKNGKPPMSRMAMDALDQIRKLRIASLIEGSTLVILLFVAVPAKHIFGYPIAVRIMGPVHGAAFTGYIWCALAAVSAGGDWSRRDIARLFGAAFVPFGGFINTHFLSRKAASIAARA